MNSTAEDDVLEEAEDSAPAKRGPRRRPSPYAVSYKFKVEFDEIADPFHDSYVSLRDLELYAYLIRTSPAGKYSGRRTAVAGGAELLSGNPHVSNMAEVDPLHAWNWRESLMRRLRCAMFSRHVSQDIRDWRRRVGLYQGGVITVTGPTVNPHSKDERNRDPGSQRKVVDHLAETSRTGLLAWSLNQYHPKAIGMQDVLISFAFATGKATIDLAYGYPPDDSSRWYFTLAHQHDGEPLIETVERAGWVLDALKDPDAIAPPIGERWEYGEKKGFRFATPAPDVTDLLLRKGGDS